MTTATTSVTKILLIGGGDEQTLVADVLAADATATTFLLNCPTGTDSNDCGTYNESVIVGPWAKPTPPPDATAGVYELNIDMPEESWSFNIHCDMSQTVPVTCTTINLGGNDDGSPTATFTSIASTDDSLGWGYYPITITSGLEKLASATGSGSGNSASATTTGGTTVVTGTGTGTGTASGTSNTASSTPNAAMSSRGEPMAGTLALAGLLFAWLMR